MTDPIRVFIGTDPSQLGAAEVLRQMILETSSLPVQVETMEKLYIPSPLDVRQSQRTGFSFARWAIPELCDFKGRALYIDADMMVFSDIKELWEMPLNGVTIAIVDGRDTSYCSDKAKGNKNETSVMVLDCGKADWTLASLIAGLDGQYQYKDMMTDLCFLNEESILRSVPRRWNSMDYWDETVSLLHYTNVPTQPWVATTNSFGHVWVNHVKRLINEGKISASFIEAQISKGYFRPSLMKELQGNTCTDPASAYAQELNTIDRAAGFVAHREQMAYTKQRDRAIRAYQLKQARSDDFNSYMTLAAHYAINDLKDIARKVLRRA